MRLVSKLPRNERSSGVPVCPRCHVAYLDGEIHKCVDGSSPGLRALVGAGIGAIGGFLGLTVYYGVTTGSAQSGLVGIFLGGPIGAAIGAIVGAGSGRRRGSRWRSR